MIVRIECSRCEKSKPTSEFAVDRSAKSGYRRWCRSCATEYSREWRAQNPQKALEYSRHYAKRNPVVYDSSYRRKHYLRTERNSNLVKQYGITKAEFEAILETQGGCAICGRQGSGVKGRQMSVDHCHKTGKVRGILCTPCNHAIGKFDDDPNRMLAAAAAYVLQHNDVLAMLEEVTA